MASGSPFRIAICLGLAMAGFGCASEPTGPEPEPVKPPTGFVTDTLRVVVCKESNKLPGPHCPTVSKDFPANSAPTETCSLSHKP